MLQTRIALFYTASALAGAFSGLLAFGIAKMDGLGGYEGWRWIFLIGKSIKQTALFTVLTIIRGHSNSLLRLCCALHPHRLDPELETMA